VQTGPTDGTDTVIQSGLNPGDKVLVDGADRLRDGAKVHGAEAWRRPGRAAATGAAAAPSGTGVERR